jgi:hypothetical protein
MVLKNIIVERFMIALLKAHAKDPRHFFYTSAKTDERQSIDPPEVGTAIWELLTLSNHVRNELAHSLDSEKLKATINAVRTGYRRYRKRAPKAKHAGNE